MGGNGASSNTGATASYSGFVPSLWLGANVSPPHAATAIWSESDKYCFIETTVANKEIDPSLGHISATPITVFSSCQIFIPPSQSNYESMLLFLHFKILCCL